jgi:hypothetical protein
LPTAIEAGIQHRTGIPAERGPFCRYRNGTNNHGSSCFRSGTESSNSLPSSGESAANLAFGSLLRDDHCQNAMRTDAGKPSPIVTGDRVRLFRRTWGTVDGREQHVGDNGDIVSGLAGSLMICGRKRRQVLFRLHRVYAEEENEDSDDRDQTSFRWTFIGHSHPVPVD